MKAVIAICFGIALLGLYLIFHSSSVPVSLSACAMYIGGTVLGVMLWQNESPG
jgi:hypothetical protein